MNERVIEFLNKNIDIKYRDFQSKLIPNKDNILGVRVPILRSFAKELVKDDVTEYLNSKHESFEEVFLEGIIIGKIKVSLDERFNLIKNFIPKIDNWAICDSFSSSLKFVNKNKQETFEFLKSYFNSKEEYELRFVFVMFINYFEDEKYIDSILKIVDKTKSQYYYVNMAISWLIADLYVKFPDIMINYLNNNNLSIWVYNKSLQKICESNKINLEQKKFIKSMKKI